MSDNAIQLAPSLHLADGLQVVLGDNLVFTARAEANNVACDVGVMNSAEDVIQRMVGIREQKNRTNIVGEKNTQQLDASESLAGPRRALNEAERLKE